MTDQDLIRRDLLSAYSGLYKDCYGVRPREDFSSLSIQDIEEKLKVLDHQTWETREPWEYEDL